MATSVDYIAFVLEQIRNYNARYKKMFGEYMVYVDDKPILLVCDNTVFVKKLDCLSTLMSDAPCGYPYDGAKEHYVLDVENEPLTTEVVNLLLKETPLPKPKSKR